MRNSCNYGTDCTYGPEEMAHAEEERRRAERLAAKLRELGIDPELSDL